MDGCNIFLVTFLNYSKMYSLLWLKIIFGAYFCFFRILLGILFFIYLSFLCLLLFLGVVEYCFFYFFLIIIYIFKLYICFFLIIYTCLLHPLSYVLIGKALFFVTNYQLIIHFEVLQSFL
jgi:hypothetical protein